MSTADSSRLANFQEQARVHRAVVRNLPSTSQVRASILKSLGDSLMVVFEVSSEVNVLEEAITVYEEALQLEPVLSDHRAQSMSDLGNALFWFCWFCGSDKERSDHCVEMLRGALDMRPSGHPLRDESLHYLARAHFHIGFELQLGGLNALSEAASMSREAVRLRPPGHPDRVKSLNTLAGTLKASFTTSGNLAFLTESISISREAVQCHSVGHPDRVRMLCNLGTLLCTIIDQTSDLGLLAEAIAVLREALENCSDEPPLRVTILDNLGSALSLRFSLQGHADSLSEAIALGREAMQFMPDTYYGRAYTSNNLAESLIAGFEQSGNVELLAEAVSLLRESLRLRLVGHVGHCLSLIALGGALQLMYDVRSDTDALIEAVAMQRNALELLPLEHTNRCTALEKLATALLSGPEAPSWTEAFNLYQEALATCPEGYAERVKMLAGMSKCHIRPDSPFFDFSLGISYLSAAYADKFNHAHQRLRSAIQSLREVEDAYEATKKRAPTSLPSNREIQVLELYTQVMGLLPYVANFGLDYDTRLRSLAGTDEIVRNAASRATHLGQLSFALELLEEGRGIFWSQSLCLRGTGFDGVPNDDRCELERLLRLLEHGARARTDPEQTAVLRDRELERRRQLNSEAEALIAKIRSYPGLERFLMPAAFDSILAALPEGHIVVVNASQLGHHALLLNRACRTAMALTLRSPRAGFDSAFLRTQLPRDMTPSVSTNHFNGTRAMRLDTGHVARSLESMLALLWTSIVEPVFSKMNLQKAAGRTRPRLWWCVTGELSFLPIHAAGNYDNAETTCAADFVVSSYIPTLSSLNRTRSHWKPISRHELGGLVICESASDSSLAAHLPNATEEVRVVRSCFDLAQASVLNQQSAHTSQSELRLLLEKTMAHILHVACHAVQNRDPLESGLVLQDGLLTIRDIMQLSLSQAVLAFLSACQTAKGDRNAPDQAVHLCASMLFCGFRSVIGTMWLMHDEDGPKVARHVYEALFRSSQLDLDDIPYALDEAVQALRTAGTPASRWALFMHMGG